MCRRGGSALPHPSGPDPRLSVEAVGAVSSTPHACPLTPAHLLLRGAWSRTSQARQQARLARAGAWLRSGSSQV